MQVDPDECPHFALEFLDVVFGEEHQYEQRYRCHHCGSTVLMQLGAFGAITNRRTFSETL